MTKATIFRDQTIEELNAQLEEFLSQLFHLINENKQTKKLDKPHQIKMLKRDIARLKTVKGEKVRTNKS